MVSHASIYRFGAVLNLTHITLTSLDTLYKQGLNYLTRFVPRGGMTFRVFPRMKRFFYIPIMLGSLCQTAPLFVLLFLGEGKERIKKKKKERKSEKKKHSLWFF